MTPDLFAEGAARVKVCGVTNPADAAAAVDAGAGAVGINLFPGSKRYVPLDEAAEWLGDVRPPRVAVVVDPTDALAAEIGGCGLFEWIQFHGDEPAPDCVRLAGGMPWVRAIRASSPDALAAAAAAYDTPWLLVDAFSPAAYGGTGVRVDSGIAAAFVRAHPGKRVVLAGGLRPSNAADAVRAVRPWGIDAAGGVERENDPRRKDPGRMAALVEAWREAEAG